MKKLLFILFISSSLFAQSNFTRIVLGTSNVGEDPNPTADITGYYDEYMSNAVNGQWDFGAANLVTTGTLNVGVTVLSSLTVTTTLDVGGLTQLDSSLTVGADGAGEDVIFYSGTAGDNFTWDASEEALTITGTNTQDALNIDDGNVDIADDIDVDGTTNLDNTDIDGTFAVDGTTISLDATTSLNIDNTNTSNGVTINTATVGSPISIGNATSETTINDNLNVTGSIDLTGDLTADGALTLESTRAAGADVSNKHKITLTAGDTFSGTTGHSFKIYDADNSVVHNGGEHTAVYANMKLLSAMQAGGKSVIYSGHNYGSGGDYQVIDAGMWLYGNFVDTWKISGGTSTTGIDFSEQTISSEEILGSNSESIDNVTNGVWNFKDANVRAATYNFADATALTGSADSLVIDFTPDIASLTPGLEVVFVAEAANTGATTLIIDGGAEKSVTEAADISALEANDIRSGMVVRLVYDGTQWQQISQSGN